MAETSQTSNTALDPQDPLPESNWIPRRWFAFSVIYLLILLKVLEVLLDQSHWETYALIFTMIVCYMIAPSAEQATKMMAQARMTIEGVKFRTAQSKAETPEGTTTTHTEQTVAKDPQPTPTYEPDEIPPEQRFHR